jgi:hypothetical protein
VVQRETAGWRSAPLNADRRTIPPTHEARYIDIRSPRDHERIYRVPRGPGLVRVIEKGRQTASLCLQPREKVPDADLVVMHKLMIEADEETYLQTANRFAPLCIKYGED